MSLSMPDDHWCPTCGIHNRSQDAYTNEHKLLDECPVCADDTRRAKDEARDVLLARMQTKRWAG